MGSASLTARRFKCLHYAVVCMYRFLSWILWCNGELEESGGSSWLLHKTSSDSSRLATTTAATWISIAS